MDSHTPSQGVRAPQGGQSLQTLESQEALAPAQSQQPQHVAQLMSLQRTIGNQAVQRLLAGARGPAPARPASPTPQVQRFPASVLKQPYAKWGEATASATSPGEGAAGGVFFLTGKTDQKYGPVQQVVVKPLVTGRWEGGSSPERYEMADQVAREFGFSTPDARSVPMNTDEFEQLKQVSEGQSGKEFEHGDSVNSVVVMARVEGTSIMGMSKRGEDGATMGAADVDKLIALLNDMNRMSKLGELMLVDAMMGNPDRITAVKNNLGNIMVTQDGFSVIDHTSNLMDLDFKRNDLAWLNLIQFINSEDNIKRAVAEVLDAIRENLGKATPSTETFQPLAYFNARFTNADKQAVDAAVWNGVIAGRDNAKRLARSKEQPERERRHRLKKQSQKDYGLGLMDGGLEHSRFDALRANARYIERYDHLIKQGVDPTDAHRDAKSTAQSYMDRKQKQRLEKELGTHKLGGGYKLSDHMKRVAEAAGLDVFKTRGLTVLFKRAKLSTSEQDELIHLRPYSVKKQQKKSNVDVDERLEAIRVVLVKLMHANAFQFPPSEVVEKARERIAKLQEVQVYDPEPTGERLNEIRAALGSGALTAIRDKYFPLPQ